MNENLTHLLLICQSCYYYYKNFTFTKLMPKFFDEKMAYQNVQKYWYTMQYL